MELFINGRQVDLNDKIPFPLTYAISDIKDISSRKGNNSKTIALPGTATNVQLMANVFSLSATQGAPMAFMNFDPAVKATAQYYHNGVLEFNGVCQLQDCVQSQGNWTFNIVLISETIDYNARLKEIRINALDWNEYNHEFTYQNQQDSWNGTIVRNGAPFTNGSGPDWYGLGYYYGLIDYGYDRSAADNFGVEHIPPHVFCYDILKRSFDSAGITWQSNFFESQRFKRLLLAYPGGVLPQITNEQAAIDSAFTTENNDADGFVMNVTMNATTMGVGIPATSSLNNYDGTVTSDLAGQVQQASPLMFVASSESLFAVRYYGEHRVTFFTDPTLDMYFTYKVSLIVRKNGVIDSTTQIYEGSLDAVNSTITFDVSFNVAPLINLSFSDVVDARLRLDITEGLLLGPTPAGVRQLTTRIESRGADLNIEKQPQSLTPGSTLNLSTMLPSMTADVFFKGIRDMFNLYIKPNVFNPTILEIEPLVDFYEGTDTAIDWTYKIDKSEPIKITPTINYAAKDYSFVFEKDDDYWSKRYADDTLMEYGNNSVSSGNAFSQNKTETKLPFSQKPLVRLPKFDGSDFTELIIPCAYQMKTESNGVINRVEKVAKPFIVQLMRGQVGNLEEGFWIHTDEFDEEHPQTKYPYVGHLDSILSPTFDLNWGVPQYVFYTTGETIAYTTNNLYAYHETFIREIISKFGKQLTAKAMLQSNDIGQLNFKKLIQIDGVVFRLQKVNNYDSGKMASTEVELIRLVTAESAQTYTITISPDKYQR
jgi:hypothetical protein